jgi:thiol:disulfide interchange protein
MLQYIAVALIVSTSGSFLNDFSESSSQTLLAQSKSRLSTQKKRRLAVSKKSKTTRKKSAAYLKKLNEERNNNFQKTGSFEGTHAKRVQRAIRRGKSSKKLVFVLFTGRQYKVSQKMEKEVFQTDYGKKFMKDVIFLRIDVDKESEIAKHYAWTFFVPKYMLIDGNGKVLKRDTGYSNAENFYNWLSR